jgi:hypothetical protein
MFNTELALQQFHILGIAQGAGSSLPHARNLLEDFGIDARANVLLPAPEWKNIKVAELMGFVCACVVCRVVTIEIEKTYGDSNCPLALKLLLQCCTILGRLLHTLWRKLQCVELEVLCV